MSECWSMLKCLLFRDSNAMIKCERKLLFFINKNSNVPIQFKNLVVKRRFLKSYVNKKLVTKNQPNLT